MYLSARLLHSVTVSQMADETSPWLDEARGRRQASPVFGCLSKIVCLLFACYLTLNLFPVGTSVSSTARQMYGYFSLTCP